MNKKLIIMAALCGFALGTHAQTEKGKVLLGGGFRYDTQSGNENTKRTNGFLIAPRAGYFISDNLVIGLGFNAYYSRTEAKEGVGNFYSNLGEENLSLGLAPFARYYFNIAPRFKVFGELEVSASKDTNKQISNNGYTGPASVDYRTYGGALSPGFAFFATKKLAFELSTPLAGYYKGKLKHLTMGDFNTNSFRFGFSTMQPRLSVNFHF